MKQNKTDINKVLEASEISKILDENSGFTLEMKVVSLLTSKKFEVEHGGTYEDPVTKKSRQFDVRAMFRDESRVIRIAAECKALSKNCPLVIQRVPRTSNESFHDAYFVHKAASRPCSLGVVDGKETAEMKTTNRSPLYPVGGSVGKACHQVEMKNDGKNGKKMSLGDSEIYDKWAQAIASSNDLLHSSVEEGYRSKEDELWSFILPVLVVSNECLWSVDYDKDGKREGEPIQIDEVDYYVNNTISYFSIPTWHVYAVSHIKILTFNGLEMLTKRIADKDSIWDEIFDKSNLCSADEPDAEDDE